MVFWDFIKKIFSESLISIKIDNRTIDNRKIEITNSSIKIGTQIIQDPEKVNALLNEISKYKDEESLPCQIIHSDLADSYLDYENISIDQKEGIEKLKSVLTPEDVGCVLMARRVKKAYEKDTELAKRLHQELNNNYPENGHKIYNLVSAGYFDELLIPFIDAFRTEYDIEYVKKYREFYASTLKFFPLAFFIGNGTTIEKLREGISERLKLKDVPFVRLHAIGKNNIDKIRKVVEEQKIDLNYDCKENPFTCSNGVQALIYEIKTKESK